MYQSVVVEWREVVPRVVPDGPSEGTFTVVMPGPSIADEPVERPVFVRADGNYSMDAASVASGIENREPSLTMQSFKEESDINVMVKRFGLVGGMPPDFNAAVFQDVSDVPDFQTALNLVRESAQEFLRLPPAVRARFDNDPLNLVAFLDNEANREEAVSLGLLQAPVVAPVVPPGDGTVTT